MLSSRSCRPRAPAELIPLIRVRGKPECTSSWHPMRCPVHPTSNRVKKMRKLSTLLTLTALLISPAAGFDSYWHLQCSQKVGEQFGFSDDAWKIMQLGNFSPDFFGPVSEYR